MARVLRQSTIGDVPKEWMIEALGEDQLLLPGLVSAALTANDRVKYMLTLLQTAAAAADGDAEVPNLREERLASGVQDSRFDGIAVASTRQGDEGYVIPGAQSLAEQALDEVSTMLAPLTAAGVAAAADLQERLERLRAELRVHDDTISYEDVLRLTAGPGYRRDTLHLLVMEAHRELNALQARIATESISGARAHDLGPGDRELVAAFMRGVHRTERLKFDHPGLGTLATRTATALVIQNDLGTTDAHVLVVRVIERTVTITYTDVHLQRLLFFQDLLSGWAVRWEDTRSRTDRAIEGGLYHLGSARFEARDVLELGRFLEHLGSRLVFIIDWNRARKRLRRLVGRRAAIDLLRWAADNEYGHIAFLRAGADGLVYEALEFASGRPVHAGESLEDVLGAAAAERYLQSVLRLCSEGLVAEHPVSLVQDEVRAELTGYLRSTRQETHGLALRHAEQCVEIAEAADEALRQAILGAADGCRGAAQRAERTEHEADLLLIEARTAAARTADLEPLLHLIEAADDIADCLEEAAFYATLLPQGQPTPTVRPGVRRIAGLVLNAAREYLRAIQLSVDLTRGGPREEMEAFLAAAHGAIESEHETDAAQREVHRALVSDAERSGAGQFVIVELTRAYEEAADALMHSAHVLREQALARVVRSEASNRRPPEPATRSRLAQPRASTDDDLYLVGDPGATIPDALTIGAKAHGLARLARAGVRVPEAAVLTTSFARRHQGGADWDQRLEEVVERAVGALEGQTGLRLGSSRRPLLVSVRSGAPVSMPGMLETVLDVGMNEGAVRGLIALHGNPRLAWDCYRRFVQSFACVVHGCLHAPFDAAVADSLAQEGVDSTRQLPAPALEALTRAHLDCFAELTGREVPQDPREQLRAAAGAVLASWEAPKAREYRRLNRIGDDLGTAVIVQRMVFGNAGGLSGAGVGFTRDPAMGNPRLYMDFLFDAQGEDIVGGRHSADGVDELALLAPEVLEEIEAACPRLEAEFGDAQEFELTVQNGTVFLLQARTAKRTPWAGLRIATDQVGEGLISTEQALERLHDLDLSDLRRVRVGPGEEPVAHAVPASVGVAIGPIALDGEAAARIAAAGGAPVLVRTETLTEDIASLAVSAGLLTRFGGRTSHAAVVARELGKPCLVGCATLEIDLVTRTASIGGHLMSEGDVICLDAESGCVYAGTPELIEERPEKELAEVAAWPRTGRMAVESLS